MLLFLIGAVFLSINTIAADAITITPLKPLPAKVAAGTGPYYGTYRVQAIPNNEILIADIVPPSIKQITGAGYCDSLTKMPASGECTLKLQLQAPNILGNIAAEIVALDEFVSGLYVVKVDVVIASLVPTVTSISPNSGSVAGGTKVTITGTNFIGDNIAVKFGEAFATLDNVTPTQIIATVPKGEVGTTVDVTVTTPTGTSNSYGFTYNTPIPTTYTIISTAGEGGAIKPQGQVQVRSGESQEFSINPTKPWCQIGSLRVDKVDVEPQSPYTFNNVVNDHTIEATFSCPNSISINNPDPIVVGGTFQFSATGSPGNVDITNLVDWQSSNIAIATVDNKGLVTGVGAGTADITATLEGMEGGSAKITVNQSGEQLIYEEREGGGYIVSIADEVKSEVTEIVIPATHNGQDVVEIKEEGFKGATNLTSVTIPESVTIIGASAFEGCGKLESADIPESVKSIGNSAFKDCTSITIIEIPESVESIGDSAFEGCNKVESAVILPESVKSIGVSVFKDCTSLTSVEISKSVEMIDNSAFENCVNLKIVTTSSSAQGRRQLQSMTIPSSVKSIGAFAFQGCIGLTSVTIPDSVTSIGQYAFKDCTQLQSVHALRNDPPRAGAGIFDNCSAEIKIFVPQDAVDRYKQASGWNTYASYIEADA